VDLLRGGPVVFEGDYYYPLAHLPNHDASDRCPVLTSWNPEMAKFAEGTMDELQALWSCTLGSPSSASKARKRSLGDWVIRDSAIRIACR
jgi:hypothetical protein